MTLAVYLLSLMLAAAPPRERTYPRGAEETADQARERYAAIADALADVAIAERPLVGGPRGRAMSAALVLAVAHHESGFRRDVDLGTGPEARGSGIDACLMQLRIGAGGTTREGWTTADVLADRRKCFAAGWHLLARSLRACGRTLEPTAILDVRLSAYASGTCSPGRNGHIPGETESRAMVATWRRWLARMPAPRDEGPSASGTAPAADVLARFAEAAP